MRLRRLLRRQDGITMIMAVGILGMLTTTGATLIYYTSTNARSAQYSVGSASAYDLAEAGIDEMMAILSKPENNSLTPTLLQETTSEYEEGSVTWSGTLNLATLTWSITSTGRIDNPNAGTDVTRTLSAKVPVTPTLTQPLNNPSWNYIYSRRTGTAGGCDQTLYNNVSGSARLYVAGNLCLENNASVTSSPLVVAGDLFVSNNAFVGTSSSMSTRVETYVGGRCKYANGSWADPCSGNQDSRQIFSKKDPPAYVVGVHTNPILIEPPGADFANWYSNAAPGPALDCSAGNGARSGTPPVWDNDGLRNNSVSTVFELTPASSYTCRIGPASGPLGELSWNATTKTLTVAGTIYLDGSMKITNGFTNQYNGQATIYLSGTLLLNNNSKLCGGIQSGACTFSAWDPNNEMLTFVVDGVGGQAGTGNGAYFDNNTQFQGGVFATNAIYLSNNTRTDGPMVASHVYMNNNVEADPFPYIITVPVGMPGNPTVYAQPNPPQLYSG